MIDGETVAAVLKEAAARYGAAFEQVLAASQIWVNREAVDSNTSVGPYGEIAVLPPICGG